MNVFSGHGRSSWPCYGCLVTLDVVCIRVFNLEDGIQGLQDHLEDNAVRVQEWNQAETPPSRAVTSPSVDGSDPEYLLSQTTSSMLFASSSGTEGKWRKQSSAKYRKTFQVCPKSFERSTNMAAGRKLCKGRE